LRSFDIYQRMRRTMDFESLEKIVGGEVFENLERGYYLLQHKPCSYKVANQFNSPRRLLLSDWLEKDPSSKSRSFAAYLQIQALYFIQIQ